MRRHLDQVGAAGDLVGLAVALEPITHRDRVRRLVLIPQRLDRLERERVVVPVEVGRREHVLDAFVGARVEHQPAQHRLLGADVLRRQAQVLDHVAASIHQPPFPR